MKNYIALFTAVLLVAFGCTETIYVELPGKTDTLKVERFIDRTFAGTDTITITQVIEVPTPTRSQTDTVVIVQYDTIETIRIDSIFIETIVYLTDTIVVRDTYYGDTLMITVGRAVFQWPLELEDMVNQFYIDAQAHGLNPPGYPMLIEYSTMDPILQAYSFTAYYQRFIKLNTTLTVDESYIPLMREMARLYLGKVYSDDPESVMHYRYPSDKIRWSNRAQYKAEIDKIFL
jgi:hypothetical protein